jgi:2-methylfumaryl-CoA isomerase
MADAVAGRDFDELADAFDAHGVCWGLYRTLSQALADDPDLSTQNPILSMVKHPAGHSYLTPGAAATFSGAERLLPARAPRFAEHTDEVLTEVLGLSSGQIATLHDRNIVEGPEKKS